MNANNSKDIMEIDFAIEYFEVLLTLFVQLSAGEN